MLTWIPLFVNFSVQLVLDLVFYPGGRQHMISFFSQQLRGSSFIVSVYFIYEIAVWFLFMWVNLFEFGLQVYFIKSIIYWTNVFE